jgi:xylulokinase
MFFNLGLENTVADMMHAVIEGVCMHLRWQMTAMSKLTPISGVIRFVGGGARTPAICQILSDVLGKPVETVDSPHNVGSVGAAAIIATGLGVFDSIEDIGNNIPVSASYEPQARNAKVYNEIFGIFQDLYKNNKKNFFKLNGKEVLV